LFRLQNSGVMRALVIDDDKVYRLLVRATLEERGWSVEEAWDGQVGWQLFQLSHYDLVVTDNVMPHQEGLETIRLIRAERSDVRILAISGGGQHGGSYLRAACWFGADATLAKPFSSSALLAAVERIMGAAADAGHVRN
jgi:DNA-binding response OmpR family regulator